MLRAPQVLNVSLIFGTVMILEVVLTVAAVMPRRSACEQHVNTWLRTM